MKCLSLLLPCLLAYVLSYSQGFTDVGASQGFEYTYGDGFYAGGASFVDFDQDGDDDLTVVSESGSFIHFHENNGGVFTEIAPLVNTLDQSKQVLWVDYDNDSDLDLYVSSASKNRLYKNLGNSTFEDITNTCGFTDPFNVTFCSVWFDYDEDGLLDVCTSHRIDLLQGYITLYRNLGNDQFQDVTAASGLANYGVSVLAMTTLDINNDGLEDLYIGQDFDPGNLLFKNNGDGTFEDISASSGTNVHNDTMTASVGDYNNDGWMDIYVTHTNEPQFYINQGDETFLEQSVQLGVGQNEFSFGVVFFDADNDMDVDLYRSGGAYSNMFMNPGDGSAFTDVTVAWGVQQPNIHGEGNTIGDFNNDGLVDVFEVHRGANHSLWQNQFDANNWIKIDLSSTVSNAMAVGAVIEAVTNGTHQYRRIGCGEGFCSQNSLVQHFGLAQNEVIDSLIIKWPSGTYQVLEQIETNQTLHISEPLFGCTISTACNYDPCAETNDGSCEFALQYYDCQGICLLDADDDGVCNALEIAGCQDQNACNFNPSATDNDLTFCEYPIDFYNCEGVCMNDSDGDGVCNELEIEGCTDSEACNFDSAATDDNNACEYLQSFEIAGEESPWLSHEFVYTYADSEGSSYTWNISGGVIISGQGTAEVIVQWNETGQGSLTIQEFIPELCVGEEVFTTVQITETNLLELDEFEVVFYPNPALNELNMSYPHSSKTTQISIINSSGRLVKNVWNETKIDLTSLDSGVYGVIILQGRAKFKSSFLKL